MFGLCLWAALLGLVAAAPSGIERRDDKIAPKLVLITMFTPETEVWLEPYKLTAHNITVPGLSPIYPDVGCNEDYSICIYTSGESEINAAASATALFFSDLFDLRKTYFLVAGIAGVNPHAGTLGSVAIAQYAVQVALQYQLDAREIPASFNGTTGYWNYDTTEPGVYPGFFYGTELFKLNSKLLSRALELASTANLTDSDTAKAFRAKYPFSPMNEPPKVFQGDALCSDSYFAGQLLGETFANLTLLLTNNTGIYAMTAQEDNAHLEVAVRADIAGKVDYGRFIVMRAASDVDRQPPGGDAYTTFEAEQGAFEIALKNLVAAGSPIINEIVYDWANWESGNPANEGVYGDVYGTLGSKSSKSLRKRHEKRFKSRHALQKSPYES